MKLRTKAGFGVAEIGISSIDLMLQIFLLELYLIAGLDPFWAGLAIALAIVWDAVSDPLMGWISDRARARSARGKRLPYIAVGCFLLGLSFCYLFSPPSEASQASLFGWLLTWYLILNTAMTLVGVPHLAIINDLSQKDSERTVLFGWRLAFGATGLLAGLAIPGWLARKRTQELIDEPISALLQLRSDSALWFALLAVSACLITIASLWKPLGKRLPQRSTHLPDWKASLKREIATAFQSPAFRAVMLAFIAISLGRAMNSSLALFYYKQTLGFTEEQFIKMILILSATIMLSAPIWVILSKKLSKSQLCLWGISLLTAQTAVCYPFLPRELFWPVAIVAITGGFLVASIALLESLFSDVVEQAKRETRQEVAGAFYGVWRMSQKIARAGGIALAGWLLAAIGYQEAAIEQTAFAERSIAWLFGPGVALFFAGGAWLISRAKVR